MADLTPTDVVAAAHTAWDAGLCVVPPREDGSKAPTGGWKQWQTERPAITSWYGNGSKRRGVGLICGQVSGGLEVVELEGAATADNLQHQLRDICDTAGIGDLLDRILTGCTVTSPTGGIHMLYQVPTPRGNTKLARRVDTDTGEITVLAETRGEGGFVVTAPSHGPVHPTGNPWVLTAGNFTTIAAITDQERNTLWDCVRVLDQMPPEPTSRPTRPSSDTRPGDTYNKHPDAYQRTLALLETHGWTNVGTSGHNTLLRRPDKNVGISATLRDDGVFYCFTTSTRFDAPAAHSPFHVYTTLQHAGDHSIAARTLTPNTPTPSAHVLANPTDQLNLPNDFWATREELDWIRQAAHSRNRSADAVLHVVLARIAAHIPHTFRIPAIVGGDAGLSYLTALIGPSGTGKSNAYQIGAQLLPTPDRGPTVLDSLPIGTGEGLIEAFFKTEKDPDDGRKLIKTQAAHNALVYIDEGQMMSELAGRKGSSLLPTLRTIFNGGTLGQTNASEERKRRLPAGTYTFGVVAGFQPTLAGTLLADSAGGTPQRFTWASVIDPHTGGTDWPGPLGWKPPTATIIGIQGPRYHYLSITDTATNEIQTNDLAKAQGRTATHELDSQRPLVHLKTAALLALLAERTNINDEDWQLATTLLDTSDTVRTWTLAQVQAEVDARTRQAGQRATRQLLAGEEDLLVSTAQKIRDRLDKDPDSPRRQVRGALYGARRGVFDDALEYAQEQGWITDEQRDRLSSG